MQSKWTGSEVVSDGLVKVGPIERGPLQAGTGRAWALRTALGVLVGAGAVCLASTPSWAGASTSFSDASGTPLASFEATLVDVSAPRLELALGRSTTRAGFALDIAGGAPHGWARLELRGEGAVTESEWVELNGQGEARILRLEHAAASPIEVRCTIPSFGVDAPFVVRTLTIPTAAQMIAQARGILTGGLGGAGGASGAGGGAPFAAAGAGQPALVITEIMKDPTTVSDSAGEWFEVRNLNAAPIDLSGWTIRDAGSNSHTIPATAGVVIPPRAYFVFGSNIDPNANGGVVVGYRYTGFTLGNGADDIQLLDASGALVDAVAYDDGIFWPDTPGKSLNLQRSLVDATSNDDGANWCDALNPISVQNGDCGTPRLANNACP